MSSVLRPDISPGQIAQIRQRTYLVEEVVKPKREATEANGKKKTKRTRKKKAEAAKEAKVAAKAKAKAEAEQREKAKLDNRLQNEKAWKLERSELGIELASAEAHK